MLGTDTLQVRDVGDVDADGDPTGTNTRTVAGCLVEPLGGTERSDVITTSSVSMARVFMPITAGIDEDCEIKIGDDWYSVIGDVVAYVNDEDPELSGYSLTCQHGEG